MGMFTQIKQNIDALQPFTQLWLKAAIVLAIIDVIWSLLIGRYPDELSWHAIINHQQVWRLITSIVYLGTFFDLLINSWFLVAVVDVVEQSMERRRFLSFVAFSALSSIGASTIFYIPYVSSSMLVSFMVLYASMAPYDKLKIWLGGCGTLEITRWAFPLLAFLPSAAFGGFAAFVWGLLIGVGWLAIMKLIGAADNFRNTSFEMSEIEPESENQPINATYQANPAAHQPNDQPINTIQSNAASASPTAPSEHGMFERTVQVA